MDPAPFDDDPLWYKDALIYELHVRAFQDSDGDGIGDFRGLTDRLDYLQDLGVTALWLLPFYPSPLRDDGYDIADYNAIHPSYGNLRDFRTFMEEAHKRGLRVITELVINHTSDEHPWFQRARKAPAGSPERDFYVWSETPDRWQDARIIFQDFEHSNWAYDNLADAYFWHRFYSHQPDLNYDNPEVMAAVKDVMDFWLEMGVDGMRLDAIPYLIERDGTNCENLPETHDVLKDLRKHLDSWDDRMFLAEANQWPEDAAAYFGDGDECHMNFHFPLMPRLFMAVRMEDRFPIIDILQQTPDIPETNQWAVFLRNHDELTLEMVTDEERDYMYRSYAHEHRMRINLGIRRRLAPLLGNNRRLIELLNGLLFSMPGTPVLYYGDEIGMGDNIYLGDRNGVRTPMQWSADRNAGFSRANPQKLYLPPIIDPEYHFETINVEAQQNNPSSLLWWMKRLIALRKRHHVFGRGSIQFLYPDNPKVLAFVREHEDERVLVVANLSRFVQAVEIDLSDHAGLTPVEMFGRTPFPKIGELPYFLTLGPHAFYWFSVDETREEISLTYRAQETVDAPQGSPVETIPVLHTAGSWQRAVSRGSEELERTLPAILRTRRWFGGKARTLQKSSIIESVPITVENATCQLVIARLEYTEGEPDTYALPVAFVEEEHADRVAEEIPSAVLARVQGRDGGDAGLLFDAMWNAEFSSGLLGMIGRSERVASATGVIEFTPAEAFDELRGDPDEEVAGQVVRAEQSNTSVVYGDRFILKLFRRVEQGENPDLEVGRFLTQRAGFEHTPPLAGVIELTRERGEPLTLGLLQGYVANEGDAWSYTLDSLSRYYESALSETADGGRRAPVPDRGVFELAADEIDDEVHSLIGPYLQSAELLGERTAQLHLALASDHDDPAFAPEGFSSLYQRSLYQSMRTLTRKTFQLLRRQVSSLEGPVRLEVEATLSREEQVLERFQALTGRRFGAVRTRTHGDYHLGQVLFTGRDFVIIDFEGEPARPLGERRLKRSPLRDVAGMLRSFHYAAYAGLFDQIDRGVVGSEEHEKALEEWTQYWHAWVSTAYLRRYLEVADGSSFLPHDPRETRVLLDAYLLEKAIYELSYELNNRPAWIRIPVQGVTQLLGADRR